MGLWTPRIAIQLCVHVVAVVDCLLTVWDSEVQLSGTRSPLGAESVPRLASIFCLFLFGLVGFDQYVFWLHVSIRLGVSYIVYPHAILYPS